MTTSRNHQEAHGTGQIEEQLDQQASAAADMQGNSELDQDVVAASNQEDSELDEIIEL